MDPVAIVRDAPPKYWTYNDAVSGDFRRKWVCTFIRQTKDGKEEMCGHTHYSYYPPEECPGETDEELPYEDENGTRIYASKDDLTEWRERHEDTKFENTFIAQAVILTSMQTLFPESAGELNLTMFCKRIPLA